MSLFLDRLRRGAWEARRKRNRKQKNQDLFPGLAAFEARARYLSENGTKSCRICGATPEPAPVFTPLMSCGHEWGELLWTPKPGVLR